MTGLWAEEKHSGTVVPAGACLVLKPKYASPGATPAEPARLNGFSNTERPDCTAIGGAAAVAAGQTVCVA
jgi:hypothetical protein